MIGKYGQNGLFRSRFSILGQPPRNLNPILRKWVGAIVLNQMQETSIALSSFYNDALHERMRAKIGFLKRERYITSFLVISRLEFSQEKICLL
ncbi:MAG: hypothetical protein V3V31_07350 [Methylococcales bacterium]